MPDDDGEAIAQEVLKEDANHERGERPEWATHEGWHRREDTGRFGTAARARAAQRDAEAKKKKLYHEGWEAEADAAVPKRPVSSRRCHPSCVCHSGRTPRAWSASSLSTSWAMASFSSSFMLAGAPPRLRSQGQQVLSGQLLLSGSF